MEDKYLTELIPLTKKEAQRRSELESLVFNKVQTFFVDLGMALIEIQEKRLYKNTHHTFKEYSAEVLDMAARTAYRYIDAARVVNTLSSTINMSDENVTHGSHFHLPLNERQARPLSGLSTEEQIKAWQLAVETAPNGKITAAHVRKTVRDLKGEQTKETVKKAKRIRSENKSRISNDFQEAFNTFLNAVQTEINSNWKTTDRYTVVKHLDGIRGVISENGAHKIPEKGYAMEMSNAEKLLAAGFNLFRMDKKLKIIEKQIRWNSWEVFGQFDDEQQLEQIFFTLLEEEKNLRA